MLSKDKHTSLFCCSIIKEEKVQNIRHLVQEKLKGLQACPGFRKCLRKQHRFVVDKFFVVSVNGDVVWDAGVVVSGAVVNVLPLRLVDNKLGKCLALKKIFFLCH